MERSRSALNALGRELFERGESSLRGRRARLDLAARGLETTSPYAVLERGYSITRDANGKAVRDASELSEGAAIETVLQSGRVSSEVTQISTGEEGA